MYSFILGKPSVSKSILEMFHFRVFTKKISWHLLGDRLISEQLLLSWVDRGI